MSFAQPIIGKRSNITLQIFEYFSKMPIELFAPKHLKVDFFCPKTPIFVIKKVAELGGT